MSGNGGVDWVFAPIPPLLRVSIDPSQIVSDEFPGVGPVTRSTTWLGTSFGIDNLVQSDAGGLNMQPSNTGIRHLVVNDVWLHPTPPAPHQQMLFLAAESGLRLRIDESGSWKAQAAAANHLYSWSFESDPLDANLIYYSTGQPARSYTDAQGIYRIDLDCFGESCPGPEQLLSDKGVWRVIASPVQPNTLYAATQEEGVLFSDDYGVSWFPLNDGLSLPASVTDITLDATGTPLLAAVRTYNGDMLAEPPQPWWSDWEEAGGVYRFESAGMARQ